MKQRYLYILTCLFVMLIVSETIAAQAVRIRGTITDAVTGEPLPFTTVSSIPVVATATVQADLNGKYQFNCPPKSESVQFYYIGYETLTVPLKSIKNEVYNVKLKPSSTQLEAVVVRASRQRYSNRNNPAVDLIRKAIANKDKNRLEANDSYEYERYERIVLSLPDLNDSIQNSFMFKKFPFLVNYIDTVKETGRMSLPFFLRENISEHYYRKDLSGKEYLIASKMANYHEMLERESLSVFLNGMVERSNIYDNRILILGNEYPSPMAPSSPNVYYYHIIDTVDVSGVSCINLDFYPRNDQDFGFRGNVYITNDSAYAIKRVEMAFTRNNSVNFVNDFSLIQEYTLIDGSWCMTFDEARIDFSTTKKKTQMLGKRINTYGKYVFNHYIPDRLFGGMNKVEEAPDYDIRAEEFWEERRLLPLSEQDQGVYDMIAEMKKDKWFNRALDLLGLAVSGYVAIGKFDMGPMESFFSFNEVEGVRLRFGGKTNTRFSKNLFFEGYGAYGFKDERFKYSVGAMYSFDPKRLHPWQYPMNLLQISYESNIETPGQFFLFGSADRFFLSFHRGSAQQMVYHNTFNLKYTREHRNGFSYIPSFTHREESPAGALIYENEHGPVPTITTSQLGLKLRFAPNERFYQVQANRFPLNFTYPVFSVNYTYGLPEFWNSQYSFHRVEAGIDKRTWFGSLGFLEIWSKAGKIWGTVPFPLLVIHQANQNYAYQDEAFNMMNYMEFVSDEYVQVNMSYSFNGWLFNRIPLIRHLKLREFITFKALWGSVSDRNRPGNNPDLFKFPINEDGDPTMYSLETGPYMEAGVGISNIFKFLRLDLVKRLNYLDNQGIDEWGIRFRLRFVF
ncbi:MAG: DUF5686 and carboxypeptidase regulatory-like domain-containing protein [Bacteroidales bacterium]|nr:DUF5686 and carboxypeptidase regulatory-like domain-containing protein [Bacteroidales bacterium]